MPRSQAAKLRRRNRKHEDDAVATEMFASDDGKVTNEVLDEVPLPPGMSGQAGGAAVEDDDSDDSERKDLPKKNKKKRAQQGSTAQMPGPPKKKEGIKTLPLILLILMTGTTLLPVLLYAGDYASSFLAKNDIMGSIGFRLGIGNVPRKRVLSFYEKHAPEKVAQVPKILADHYGDYPKLIRKLERKYQDYGYFLEWEQDEKPTALISETVMDAYAIWIKQWNQYAPQILKTAARNARYNLTAIYKQGHKIWKKKVWPMLQPIFGVPDGAEKQKRHDAAEARKRRGNDPKKMSTRRKNREFRDDVED